MALVTILVLWPFAATAQSVNTNMWVPNGPVNATVPAGNTIYIGGDFTYVGPYTGGGVPLDETTGAPAGPFPVVSGVIYAVAPDGSGGWFIGGNFTAVGSVPRSNLAQVLSDGTVSAWDPNADNEVDALAVSGNTVYAGGGFWSIGGQSRDYLAALDATTGAATAWDPSAVDWVGALAVSGTTVYVGGYFWRIGGQPRSYIAALDATTGAATSWDPNANAPVYAMALGGTTVYASGWFTGIGGQTRNSIAEIDAATGAATAWDPNASGWVGSLAVSGSTVYAGGSFWRIGGQPRSNIAALDATTGAATPWAPNASSGVQALAVSGTAVYAGGYFWNIGGQPRSNIAALDISTGAATAWDPKAVGPVYALAASGTTVYAGGEVTNFGGQPRNCLAALDATTGTATAWDPNVGGSYSAVEAMAMSGTTLYVGGWFTSVGGQPRTGIAALDATTGAATAWNPSASGGVLALALGGATVYAGGDFTDIGGQPRNNIAALDAATGAATAWDPNAGGTYPYIEALALSRPTAYAGGDFTVIGGEQRNYIAALDATTGAATAWDPNAGGDYPSVRALAVDGPTVYAGGWFTSIGGQTRNYLAALDATTGLATAWNPNASAGVLSLAVSGATVYAGGQFWEIGGQPRTGVAAIDATTGAAAAWDPEADNEVDALAVSGTTVYAGGWFLNICGQPHPFFAALSASPEPTGACCHWSNGACTVTTPEDCRAPNAWQGSNTSCTPNPCGAQGCLLAIAPTGLWYHVVVQHETRSGLPLQVGDKLAVLDGSLVVGSATFTGSDTLDIPAIAADLAHGLPGFTQGDPIAFRLCPLAGGGPIAGLATWASGGYFGAGPFSVASLVEFGRCFFNSQVQVPAGQWRLLGFPLVLGSNSAPELFAGLADLDLAGNDAGGAYIPQYRLDSLSPVSNTEAYEIYCSRDDTTQVMGTDPVDPSTAPCGIAPGRWNWVPYLSGSCDPTCGDDISIAMASVANCIAIVKDSDGHVWIPDTTDTIGRLVAGRGYYAFLKDSCSARDLTYPACAGARNQKMANRESKAAKSSGVAHYHPVPTGHPEIILVRSVLGTGIAAGDEVGVFANDVLVGATRFEGTTPFPIAVWREDKAHGLPGFGPGSTMSVRIWSAATEREATASLRTDRGPASFVFQPYLRAMLDVSARASGADAGGVFKPMVRVEPNPTRGTAHISYSLPSAGPADLSIYNVAGRVVRQFVSGAHPAGAFSLDWDGRDANGKPLGSGVYFVRMRAGTVGLTERLVLIP